MALRRAAHENISYRRGLPIGYLQSLGLGVNPSTNIKARRDFIKKAKVLVAKLADHLDDIDTGVDQMGIQFMHDALPPVLTPGMLFYFLKGFVLRNRIVFSMI